MSNKIRHTHAPTRPGIRVAPKYRYTRLVTVENSAESEQISVIFHPPKFVKSRLAGFVGKHRLRRNHDVSRKKQAGRNSHVSKENSITTLKQEDSNTLIPREPRYVAHWKIAIVYNDHGKNEIFHGRTYEVSLSGTSIFSDHNIFVTDDVTVLLALPWYTSKQKEKIIEIRGRMAYTILSSENHQFRIGLQFLSFQKGEEHYIATSLKDRRQIISIY